MKYIEEIRDYWNQRANGFSLAVDEELGGESAKYWQRIFSEEIAPASCVLDDGTGAGFFPMILSTLGHQVTAIDYSDKMVASAKERFERAGVKADLRQMDAQNLDFADESFDAVVSRNVIWNLDDPAKAYREIHRVLKPGGVVIIEDGNIYLYMHNERYKEEHDRMMAERKKDTEEKQSLHSRHNVDHVDFSIIERIAGELDSSRVERPMWDFNELIGLGFDDIRVRTEGKNLPMRFLITAKKKER